VANSFGWNNTDVTANWSCADTTSGPVATGVHTTLTAEGANQSASGTCEDAAGNTASNTQSGINIDKTSPSVSLAADRAPDHNGWYNHSLTVTTSGSDPLSGIASCSAAQSYSGPDSATASVNGSCTDKAGNPGANTLAFQYDATNPTIALASRTAANANGWNNTDVSLSWSCADTTSGVASPSVSDTVSSEGAGQASTGTCTDNAGNAASDTQTNINIDKTAPTVSVTPNRAADYNGWFNHTLAIGTHGTDTLSGIESCSPDQTYDTPDTASAAVSGSCTDKAGNTASDTVSFKFDKTAPSVTLSLARDADHNGWYNKPVGYSAAATDATSGVEGCDPAATYNGPDSASASVTLSCRDNAGNSSSDSKTFKYDATAPTITLASRTAANAHGWNNTDVALSWNCADAMSGPVDATVSQTVSSEGANQSSTGTCADDAGNSATDTRTHINIDKTAPNVTVGPNRSPDHNGWFNHIVTIETHGTDSLSGIDSCSADQTYDSPDNGSASVSGSCTDNAGNSSGGTASFKFDKTAPTVTLSLARDPDHNGWYNHPVGYSATATDGTSGVDGCDAPSTYNGPDSGSASVSLSCTDQAGNTGSDSKTFQYDATAPTLSLALARAADHNGWFNHAVGYGVASSSDATSGIDACDPDATYNGPDSGSATVARSCVDKAGNTASATIGFKYDATAPSLAVALARSADHNGWYNHAVDYGVSAKSDATSGIDGCDANATYSGPDTGSASVSRSCTDVAGNTASNSVSFQYDSTAPAVTLSPDRPADHNGWYNHALTLTADATDATSGKDTCQPALVYIGPDDGSASITRTCTDNAGNTGSDTFKFKYDNTNPLVTVSPDRQADHNGWYSHSLTLTTDATDATSGKDTCASALTYGGPDNGTASVSRTCTDQAGNVGTGTFGFRYDATSPSVAIALARTPDHNGWYNHAVGYGVSSSGDATSGIDSCDANATYSGPDGGSVTVSRSCTDKAGNSASDSKTFQYDATNPTITFVNRTTPNANGWNNTDVTVNWSCADPTSGPLATAVHDTLTAEAANQSSTGTCEDFAGNTASNAQTGINIDKTAPSVTVAPARSPDHNGWFNHAVTIQTQGTDGLSGIASCSADQPYDGPDTGSASISGSCTDKAGNSSGATAAFRFDKTAPSVTLSLARAADHNGWYNAPVGYSAAATDATSGVDACNAPATYSGPDSAAASVTLSCTDKAGNSASDSKSFEYDATAPTIAFTGRTTPNSFGWNNTDVTLNWSCADTSSGSGVLLAATHATLTNEGANQSSTGTCEDYAGNKSSGTQTGINIDKTAPDVTLSPDRAADHNSWYNHSLTLSTHGADGLSGINACSADTTYTGPDTSTGSISGSCSDKAGNSTTKSFAFKYDSTAPSATTTLGRGADQNNWYNHPVGWATTGSDATSGIDASTCSSGTYAGPDTRGAKVTGTCADNAGNVSAPADSALFNYDNTPPTSVATALNRLPDHNGWYNANVGWATSGTDATSGIASCSSGTYSGPDTGSATVSGTCTDAAGNTSASAASAAFKFDKTAPTVTCQTPIPSFLLGQSPASVTATVADATSQPVAANLTGAADTSTITVGGTPRTVSLTGSDIAGNTTTVACGYTVAYRWDGFLQPINDTAHQVGLSTSVFKAGSTVPAKLQLKRADGTVVQAATAPVWLTPIKGGAMTSPVDESLYTDTPTAGSSFVWDGTQYQYNWNTKGFTAGYWYQICAKLDDGQKVCVNIGLK
jgi:hypothetical protein